jgi:hypothetical protein
MNKMKNVEGFGMNIFDLAALVLPVALMSQFVFPKFFSPKTVSFLTGSITGIAASTASLIYCILADGDAASDNKSSVLFSQSGKGQPVSRYDRSRYANNGRPDDSYTSKRGEGRTQYKKCYFKDGSMRMVPIGPSAEKTALNPRQSAPTTSSFSGISMSPGEVTRDLTTEKDFVARQNEKKDLETARPQQIASQEEAADAGDGDVGW